MSNKIVQLINNLQDLKSATYGSPNIARKSDAAAERVLDLIFEIGRRELQFTEENKKTISTLMVDAILPIQINIERDGCFHRTRLTNTILRKRSALQFLLDNYGSFPSGIATLSSEFSKTNRIREAIRILDNIIAEWHDVSDSDEVQSDRETPSSGLPSSHTWWSI